MINKCIFTAMVLFLTCSLFSDDINQIQQPINILVIHSYHQGLEWTDGISEGIRSVFSEKGQDYEIYFEYLDTKRNSGEEYFLRLSDFEKQKTQLANIDFKVIIASDNDALRFMVEYGEDLFPSVPVVFCGVNYFTPSMLKGKTNITGVREVVDYKSTIDIMSKLHPEKKRILIVLDETSTGIAIKKELDDIVPLFKNRFEFEYYRELKPVSVEKKIRELGDDYLIYLLSYNSSRDGVFISYKDAIEKIYAYSKVPIYGSWDFFFGKGIVGGMITSSFSQGEQAALLAKRILQGENPVDIEISNNGTNKYMFDYRELKRFGIGLNRLPSVSFIANAPLKFYQRYRPLLIFLLFSIVLFFLYFFIFNEIQKRKKENLKIQNEILDRKVKLQTEILQSEIAERVKFQNSLELKNQKLEEALSEVKVLSGLLPICAHCKKIRDDNGYWNQIESYFHKHSNIDFSHGLCPDCAVELYPQYFKKE